MLKREYNIICKDGTEKIVLFFHKHNRNTMA